MKYNQKYINFVDAYFTNGFHRTNAYMTAFGVDYNSARKNVAQLMERQDIRVLMEEKQAEIRERANIKKEDILTQLMNIAYDENNGKNVRLKALNEINKMLGFLAPTESTIKLTGEQPLFNDDDINK